MCAVRGMDSNNIKKKLNASLQKYLVPLFPVATGIESMLRNDL